jgi:hypothetical protein
VKENVSLVEPRVPLLLNTIPKDEPIRTLASYLVALLAAVHLTVTVADPGAEVAVTCEATFEYALTTSGWRTRMQLKIKLENVRKTFNLMTLSP